MKKVICFLCVFVVLISSVVFTVSAADNNYSTYADLLSSNTTVQNLLSLRSDKELNKKYVCFRADNTLYLLLMSDSFESSGKKLTFNEAVVIMYDTSIQGTTSSKYFKTEIGSGAVTVNHVVSSDFLGGSSRDGTKSFNTVFICLLFCILAVVVFSVFRRFK